MGQSMENHQNRTFRYERKFFLDNTDRPFVEGLIKLHPSLISEIYHERYVNNIYFDYPDFRNFSDNANGNMYRKKYRIRWYGDMMSSIANPVLEVKIKKGMVGTKESYPLNPFRLTPDIKTSDISTLIKTSIDNSSIKHSLLDQKAVLINRYRRKYYQTFNKKFRITLDDRQCFWKINCLNNSLLTKREDNSNVVIELKYDKIHDHEAANMIRYFNFRLSKSSKYARGIEFHYL